MKFRDRIRTIKGLSVNYSNGVGRVVEYYHDDRVLLHLEPGVNYTIYDESRGLTLTLVSDGTDKIVLHVEDLERYNRM